MTWIYATAYFIGAVLSARLIYKQCVKSDYEQSMNEFGITDEEWSLNEAKKFGLTAALFGLIWPVFWPVSFIIDFILRPTEVEKKIEHEKKVEAEVKRLRVLFETADMDSPDTVTLYKMAEDNVKNG